MTNKIPMINKVGLSVQVGPEFYNEILKLSQELDLSISKLQRKALKEFIINHQKGVSEDAKPKRKPKSKSLSISSDNERSTKA